MRFRNVQINRREAMAALGLLTLSACNDDGTLSTVADSSSSSSSSSSSTTTTSVKTAAASEAGSVGECSVGAANIAMPAATSMGAYPAFDNGIVTLAALNRSDMITDPSGLYVPRQGVPLRMDLTLVDGRDGETALSGYDVYAWHGDADGYYSAYADQEGFLGRRSYERGYFLRAVQTTDACGEVSFSTVFPGWRAGRYPHLCIVVAQSSAPVLVTQLTWDAQTIASAYRSALYTQGMPDVSLATDPIFLGDSAYVAATTGDAESGFRSRWRLGISV